MAQPERLTLAVHLERFTKANIGMMLDKRYIKPIPKLSGDMAQWIASLLDMVNILLNMVHFQQNSNWKGFLDIFYEFQIYCFSQNYHDYAKNWSYIYCYMLRLEIDNKEGAQLNARRGVYWLANWCCSY